MRGARSAPSVFIIGQCALGNIIPPTPSSLNARSQLEGRLEELRAMVEGASLKVERLKEARARGRGGARVSARG